MNGLRDIITANRPVARLGGLADRHGVRRRRIRTNFCTMGSISDFMTFGDFRRFRAWILAGAMAIIGAQLLDCGRRRAAVEVDVSRAERSTGSAISLGGLMFGYGMVFAGGCASRNLARVGARRSALAARRSIVMGLFAYMAIGGILGPAARRDSSRRPASTSGRCSSRRRASARCSAPARPRRDGGNLLAMAALIAAAALVYCFKDAGFRDLRLHILSRRRHRPVRGRRLGADRPRLRRDGRPTGRRRSRSPTCARPPTRSSGCSASPPA